MNVPVCYYCESCSRSRISYVCELFDQRFLYLRGLSPAREIPFHMTERLFSHPFCFSARFDGHSGVRHGFKSFIRNFFSRFLANPVCSFIHSFKRGVHLI